jgi:predicted  nucleic acid-binding Zn-ribbon protein
LGYTVTQLRNKIAQLSTDLSKQEHRYKSVRGTVRRLQSDKKDLEHENKDLEEHAGRLAVNYDHLKERYDKVMNVAVIPYARNKGIDLNRKNGEPLDATLRRLLQDALRVEIPQDRSRVQQVAPNATKAQPQPLVERLKNSQREIQAWRGRIRDAEGREQALRQQVQDLQADLLARVETTQAISDDDLAQDFRTLVSMIRTLSRLMSLDESIDVADILGTPAFLQDVSPHYWRGRAQKKRFVEAWTWAVICSIIFETPFSIFGTEAVRLSESWTQVFGNKHQSGWPCPSRPCELWRYTTSEQLVQSVGQDMIVRGEGCSANELSKARVLEARRVATEFIEARLQPIDSTIDHVQVSRIIDKAFKIAMRMSLEHSRLQVTFPKTGAKFAVSCMVSMPDRDGEDTHDTVVAYVVNPGLTKWGDARGENYECRLDIVPSLVQLEPAGIKCEPI